MPCYRPLHGFKSRSLNKSGKRSIVFNPSEGYKDMPVTLPCGQCIGCRLERSRQWAIRCVHEAQCWPDNCFITLTYAPEHLPPNGSLVKSDFQKFMKRLREKFAQPHRNSFGVQFDHIRYYMCGEYGDENDRPHYHALLFNFCFPDLWEWKEYRGNKYYRSPTLEALWPFGHCAVGEANFETAAYIARYILKKRTGPEALDHYCTYDSGGEIHAERVPEYNLPSRGYGIGAKWFERFSSDVFPSDTVIMRGREMRPPKFYDRLFEKDSPEEMRVIKNKRVEVAKAHASNNNSLRLEVRERKKHLDARRLIRSYENET